MYENNTSILKQMDWNYPDGFWKEFFEKETEQERLKMLFGRYKEQLELFEKIPLWETGKMPGEKTEVGLQVEPAIYFFPCEGISKGTVLVTPGGGYSCIATDVEGFPIIAELLKKGFSAALMIYRLKPYSQYQSLEDIQRAVRVLRYRGEKLGIAEKPIFVMGHSAGGHLASMISVHYDLGNPEAEEAIERMSCKPDGVIIGYGSFTQVSYPVYGAFIKFDDAMEPEEAALKSCFSDEYRSDMVFFSPEKHITPETSPMFLWQTCDEDDPRNMFILAKELADCGVRFEAHVFPYGGHGNGLWDGNSGRREKDSHVAHWFEMAVEWMNQTMEREYGLKTDRDFS